MKLRSLLKLGLGTILISTHAFGTGGPDSSSSETSASPIATSNPTQGPKSADVPSFWDQDLLTGDWGGMRKKLEDDGFKVSPTWTGEVMGNPTGGAAQGITEKGLFNVELDFDLGKMSGGAVEDMAIHANVFYAYGPGLSQKYVGDFSNTSSIQAYNSVHLQELWVEKLFWDQRFSLKVGNMSIDTEFFQSPNACLFLGATWGVPTVLANNVDDLPAFPLASPGVRIRLQPTDKFYVMAGVYGMDFNSEIETNNHYGTSFSLDSSSGMLVMTETGYLLNQGPKDHGLQGSYRLGSFVETADWNNWGSQAHAALGTGSLQGAGVNYGIYGMVDQQLYAKGDQAISLFMFGGGAPSNVNFVSSYIHGGFNFTGFIPGRKDDVAGVAMAHSHVSGNYSNSQVLQGNSPYTEESVLEATYKVQVTPWWTIQPDFQYIMNPSGVVGSPNAVVLGVRTSVAF